MTNLNDCKIITLKKIADKTRGNLTVAEQAIDVPFEIKRVYWIYDVPGGESRGGHAHKSL
ncbi:MAG: WxcM-like domain-containing protein, partial [Prevotella sp.]|nr:WxcM-like domain-containing protein [Prevotella sp.]